MNQDDSMEFERKKRRFLEEVDDLYDLMKRLPWVILAGLTFVGFLWIAGVVPQNELRGLAVRDMGPFIVPSKVDARIQKGLVEVPLSDLLEKRMITFEYHSNGKRMPLLAYQAPTGKIVTAIGLSKRCNSQSFHIEGAEMVCDLCHTRWELESLKGIEGECQGESLEMVPHFVYGGRLIIRETDVQKKKPQMAGERAWISA